MANYYWVGATASAGISRYDFNTPANWQLAYWSSQATGASFGWNFASATAAPGPGDNVFVGTSNVGVIPQSLSPCLYGGYSGNSAFGSWLNAGPLVAGALTGGTNNSSLNSITVDMTSSKYPYNFFGGGLTGTQLNWVLNFDNGPTGDLVGATAERAYKPMKLKVTSSIILRTGANDLADIQTVKSLSYNSTTNIVNTNAIINGVGFVRMVGGSYSSIVNQGSGNLYLEGLTCGDLFTTSSGVYTSSNTRFSNVTVSGTYTAPMWFGGALDSTTVLADLGFTGSITGNQASSNDSTMTINPIDGWWTGGGVTSNPTFYVGLPGITSSSVYCNKIVISSSQGVSGSHPASSAKWNLVVSGGLSAQAIELSDATIRAYDYLDPTLAIKIGTLGMARNALLDLSYNGVFDNWQFGSVTGTANNITIAGGVVFRDETPKIQGSAGVRLFNTQVSLGGRFDTRTGKITNTTTQQVQAAPEPI
jgi:hypothetical protein